MDLERSREYMSLYLKHLYHKIFHFWCLMLHESTRFMSGLPRFIRMSWPLLLSSSQYFPAPPPYLYYNIVYAKRQGRLCDTHRLGCGECLLLILAGASSKLGVVCVWTHGVVMTISSCVTLEWIDGTRGPILTIMIR